jgi:hypothetical protein
MVYGTNIFKNLPTEMNLNGSFLALLVRHETAPTACLFRLHDLIHGGAWLKKSVEVSPIQSGLYLQKWSGHFSSCHNVVVRINFSNKRAAGIVIDRTDISPRSSWRRNHTLMLQIKKITIETKGEIKTDREL